MKNRSSFSKVMLLATMVLVIFMIIPIANSQTPPQQNAPTSVPPNDSDFTGSKPLLLAVGRAMECDPMEGCKDTSPEDLGLPRFLRIDFSKKTIRPVRSGEDVPDTVIKRSEMVEGKLILQGAEEGYEGVHDGLGWTIAINASDGKQY